MTALYVLLLHLLVSPLEIHLPSLFFTFSTHGSLSSPTTFFEWARKGKLSLFSVWPLGGAKDTALFKQAQEGRGRAGGAGGGGAPFPKAVARTVGSGLW